MHYSSSEMTNLKLTDCLQEETKLWNNWWQIIMRNIIKQQGKTPSREEDMMFVLVSPQGYGLNPTEGCI